LGYRFFNKGESILRSLPYSFFMVYVMNEIQFQVVRIKITQLKVGH